MNTATMHAASSPPRATKAWLGSASDLGLIAVTAAAVALAWWIGQSGWFEAGDDLGYWIGVAGGTLMLALMLYPVRKYLRVLRNAGRVKTWFWMHMICGLLGPWLILVHSTFRIGSLNAGVALYSMVIVVASGIVGRFLFVRVQHRLSGGHAALQELRTSLGLVHDETESHFAFAPEVLAELQAFERAAVPPAGRAPLPLPRLLAVPWTRWRAQRRCLALLESRLRKQVRTEQLPPSVTRRRREQARAWLQRYFDAVLEVAHYSLFDRLFAFWHVAHLPFVVLLVLSAIVHVVAVHAY